ncbi:MAG: hypothetical protein WA739_00060, partial [Candidatus Acidiferrales bacterium]
PAQWGGLDARKTPATGEVFFFLTPFMELIRSWPIFGVRSARKKRISLASTIVLLKFADGEALIPAQPIKRETAVSDIGANNHR